jgi:hypothetical protein
LDTTKKSTFRPDFPDVGITSASGTQDLGSNPGRENGLWGVHSSAVVNDELNMFCVYLRNKGIGHKNTF